MRLENKVILITASTRGIGLACVKACAKEGAIVYMAARNLEAAKKTANELNAQGYHIPQNKNLQVIIQLGGFIV
jgi:NAD(P)-dependent dehydrogenase (short-subunit alcohol dehydrogenase family)